jgi:hypothetical protein
MSHNWNNIPEINLPDGWTFFDYNEKREWEIRPETKVMPRMKWDFDGKSHKILKVFTAKANHHCIAGFPVYLQEGVKYRFSMRAWAWSSVEDDPTLSRGGHYYTRIGVIFDKDKFKLDDFYLSNHEQPGVETIDHWETHNLKFTSPDDMVAYLVIECKTRWGVDHNDSYWDLDSFEFESLTSPPKPTPDDMAERVAACEAAIERLTQAFEKLVEAGEIAIGGTQ